MALKQTPENQLIEIKAWAERSKVEVEGVYVDETSSRDTRPQKELVLKKIRMHEIDGVVFWKFDRWGRTMQELVTDISEFSEMNWLMVSTTEGFDLSTPAGRLLAHMLAAFANFERDMIHERTMLGLARARAQGKKLGRPRKSPPVNTPKSDEEAPEPEKTDVLGEAKGPVT
jgi:DNA invertase Pin-like site-specific DNA recombinase